MHEWFITENAPDKSFLLKLLRTIEGFRGSDRYRAIANEELEWMTAAKGTKVLVSLSYLEKLGFLKRWYNVPSQLSVRFHTSWIEGMEPADVELRYLFRVLKESKSRTILELSEATDLSPKAVMEQLAELQSDGYIQYWGQEDLLLIELLQDSELLSTLTDEQIEVGDYIHRKQSQIDQVVVYALEATCRTRVIRNYFGEDVAGDYRCGRCDLCQIGSL